MSGLPLSAVLAAEKKKQKSGCPYESPSAQALAPCGAALGQQWLIQRYPEHRRSEVQREVNRKAGLQGGTGWCTTMWYVGDEGQTGTVALGSKMPSHRLR